MQFWDDGFWVSGFWSVGFWGPDRAAAQPTTGGGWSYTPRRRKTENDEALLLLGLC